MANCLPQISEILVGAKHYYIIEEEEMSAACRIVSVPVPTEDGSVGGFSVRSIFNPQHSYSGMLYRISECILMKLNGYGEQQVMKISKIFSFKINRVYYIFISGLLYEFTGIHMNSGNPIVTKSTHLLMIKAQDILRKVMLYPTHIDTEYIVIDYGRTEFPLQPEDIVIPQHPEPGDMVSVSGEEGETWLASVHSSDPTSQTCQVYFYIQVENDSMLYRKEHHKLEQVHWNSVLGLVSGQWQHGGTQYLLDACL